MLNLQFPKMIKPFLLRKWLVPRQKQANKGVFGHVLVLAGSKTMMGAARLCAAGALRSGAGLVTWGVPQSQLVRTRSGPWEAMTLPLKDKAGSFVPRAVGQVINFVNHRRISSVVVGPGMSTAVHTIDFVTTLLSRIDVPVVVDADAINAMAKAGRPKNMSAPVIITPHPGELARLLKTSAAKIQADRVVSVLKFLDSIKNRKSKIKNPVVCVLKGHQTIVTDGQKVFVNPTGNAGMASGGTGDVLSGMMAGLIGQVSGQDVLEKILHASLISAYIHGLAGDLAVKDKTKLGLVAGDLLNYLPQAFRHVFGNKI